jgi:hypothetical protein
MTAYASGYTRYSSGPMVIGERVDELDLVTGIGQRQGTFSWQLVDRDSGENIGTLKPIEDQPATISYDAGRTIKRELRLTLQESDREDINILTDAIRPYYVLSGRSWPLGLYCWAAPTTYISTGGDDTDEILQDRMSIVDRGLLAGVSGLRQPAETLARRVLADMTNPPATVKIEASPYTATGAWRMGTGRGQALASIATIGDYETPWFNFSDEFEMVRTVDPITGIPSVDWDLNQLVIMDTPTLADNLVDLPNRFVVIGNGASSVGGEIVGTYDAPSSAPHSIQNRGFVIQDVYGYDVASSGQARAIARNIGLKSRAIQQADVSTPIDPRFEAYIIVRWLGLNWVSVAWTMECVEGGDMTHTVRRGYQP